MDISKHEQTLYTMTDVTTNKIIIQVCHNNIVNLWLCVQVCTQEIPRLKISNYLLLSEGPSQISALH